MIVLCSDNMKTNQMSVKHNMIEMLSLMRHVMEN